MGGNRRLQSLRPENPGSQKKGYLTLDGEGHRGMLAAAEHLCCGKNVGIAAAEPGMLRAGLQALADNGFCVLHSYGRRPARASCRYVLGAW